MAHLQQSLAFIYKPGPGGAAQHALQYYNFLGFTSRFSNYYLEVAVVSFVLHCVTSDVLSTQ